MRCRECGAELADDVRACPACDGDAGEALPVVDLEDTELGIRTEDRYAYIPPGPQWIRRRVHDNSMRIPIAILVGLALFFVLGAWLQRSGRDRVAAPREVRVQSLPALQRGTGTSLLVLAPDGVRALDVDRKRVRDGAVAELPAGPATAAMTSGDRAVVVVDHRAYVVPLSLDGPATSIGPAVEVFRSQHDQRVWLLTYPADGTVVARELGLDGVETAAPAVLGGSATVRGTAGGKLVIDRLSADGTRSLATWNPTSTAEPTETFRTGALFVASGRDVVASRPSGCGGGQCDLYLDDMSTGRHQLIQNALGGGGVAAAAFTDDGRHLGVVESDGAQSRGTLVDITTGTLTHFVAGPVASTRPALAWSHDGAWLFVTTSTGAIDAIDRKGHAYGISAPRVEGAALLTR